MGGKLMKQIDSAYPTFSKGQKRIAAYIREHYDKAAFMTAARLGSTVGVSESTVVRFATEVGYDGYPQFQRALQEMIRSRLTSIQRMELSDERIGRTDVLNKVLQTDSDTVRRTMEERNDEAFYGAVADIISARRIFIMGVRSAEALAIFISFYFTHIFDHIHKIDTSSTSSIFEQMLRMNSEDVFIGMTFSRYSSRTLKAASFAKSRGAKVIAITDSPSAPISRVADHVLVAKSDMASFVDSLVAPLSLINALIVAIGLEKKEEIRDTYEELEEIWDRFGVYEKSDEAIFEGERDE